MSDTTAQDVAHRARKSMWAVLTLAVALLAVAVALLAVAGATSFAAIREPSAFSPLGPYPQPFRITP